MLDKLNPFSKEYKIKKEYLNIIKEYDKLVDLDAEPIGTDNIELLKAKNDLLDISKKKLLFSLNLLRKEISKDINSKSDLWKLKRLHKCKGKVFYIKKSLVDYIDIYTQGVNYIDLNITDFNFYIKKAEIENSTLQEYLKNVLIHKINNKEDRLNKGLRKAIENSTNIKFPNIVTSIYDYYLYKKIKITSKSYFRIILDKTIIIDRENLAFFEYCSKKFNVDIIIPV